jgi:hypothetical protein
LANYEEITAFPAGTVLSALVFTLAARAVWLRRSTWRVPWELAGTFNVVAQTGELFLLSRHADRWLSGPLHSVTGLWNIEDLLGHLLYMCGMVSVTYMVLAQLNMSDRQFSRFLKRRVELPAHLFFPFAWMMFALAGFGERDSDMILDAPTVWSRFYFLMYVLADFYLLWLIIPALYIIRRDPRQRAAATVYLGAAYITLAGCIAVLIDIPVVVWVGIRIETAAYAVAAIYAWHARARYLRGRAACP